jgi:hypothetical protein
MDDPTERPVPQQAPHIGTRQAKPFGGPSRIISENHDLVAAIEKRPSKVESVKATMDYNSNFHGLRPFDDFASIRSIVSIRSL